MSQCRRGGLEGITNIAAHTASKAPHRAGHENLKLKSIYWVSPGSEAPTAWDPSDFGPERKPLPRQEPTQDILHGPFTTKFPDHTPAKYGSSPMSRPLHARARPQSSFCHRAVPQTTCLVADKLLAAGRVSMMELLP